MKRADETDVFRAIADPTRRELIALLADREWPVKELAAPFAMSRPAISQHLAVLQQAGLVTERRVGRERRYRLEPRPLEEVRDWIRQYERFWIGKLEALGHFLDDQERAIDRQN